MRLACVLGGRASGASLLFVNKLGVSSVFSLSFFSGDFLRFSAGVGGLRVFV